MESMPNWYRWLLIASATLILCACRAPLRPQFVAQAQPRPARSTSDSVAHVPHRRQDPPLPEITGRANQVARVSDLEPAGGSRAAQVLQRVRQRTPPSQTALAEPTSTDSFVSNSPDSKVVERPERPVDLVDNQRVSDQPPGASPRFLPATPGTTAGRLIESAGREPSSAAAPDDSGSTAESATQMWMTSTDEMPAIETSEETDALNLNVPPAGATVQAQFVPDFADDLAEIEPESDDESWTTTPADAVENSEGSEIYLDSTITLPLNPETLEPAPLTSGVESHVADAAAGCPPPTFDAPCREFCAPVGSAFGRINPAQAYPDEYLCDGGDAESEVRVRRDWSLRNLDPEDTIGHFDTLDGRLIVEPSNRVCIYAPRFAATRKVTAAFENETRLQPLSAAAPLVAATDKLRQASDLYKQNVAAQRHLKVQPASQFRERVPGTEASQRAALLVSNGDLSAHEDFRVMRYGIHRQSEKTRLIEFTQAAVAWSHDTAVQVILDEVAAETQGTAEGVEEYFTVGPQGAPKLRVIKTASVADALPGEEVEFTLRFDNVGHQDIGNVTIVDNLTTRLEYVEDTAACSVEAAFSTDANDVDSLTLRWEIDAPLKPGAGGVIRFRCRVR